MISKMQPTGEIEIDENVFGRRRKYEKGEIKGMAVWIVGLIERGTNKMIMYPVEDRTEETMKKIIARHVPRGNNLHRQLAILQLDQ